MSKNTRVYQITINNPAEKGLEHKEINKILSKSKTDFYCMADEIAPETGTYHTHLFVMFTNPIRMSTLAKRFKNSHCEPIDTKIKGVIQSNIYYIQKVGSHADKKECQVEGTYEEKGTRPIEKEIKEKETLTDIIYKFIEEDMSTAEMVRADKRLINKIKTIDETRQLLKAEKYLTENRTNLEVVYIEGPAGCGKTRLIYDRYDFSQIARITSYNSKRGVIFDNYNNFQDILVLDDFDSKYIPIVDMLGYLDIYPLMLPARYFDRVACYTKVFIISNISYQYQYSYEREFDLEKYRAFDRRIKKRMKFNKNGTITFFKKDKQGFWETYEPIIKNKEREELFDEK